MTLSEDEYNYFDYQHDPEDFWEGPPLIKTKSRILYCVVNNDIDGLKLLANYPNFFQITDTWGYPILQIAILRDNVVVFDFLLSLDGCPLETCNKEGETALEVALTGFVSNDIWMGEHFAYSLLKKGAKIDYVCHFENNSLLHCALERSFLKVARLLIEKGADLNCQNDDGVTPTHKAFDCDDVNEALAMLLYFGADPSIPDFQGVRVVDFALTFDNLSPEMKEILLFYLFDDYSAGYDIPIDTLFNLLQKESPLFPQVLKHTISVNMDKARVHGNLKYSYTKLFTIKSEYLELLLEKFDYVIEEILDASLEDDFIDYAPPKPVFFQNLDLLLQSRFSSSVIQMVNKTQIYRFIQKFQNSNVPQKELSESIMLLLSYGANICDKDLNMIYKIFGDCEYFRILLHMDIEITEKTLNLDNIMPSLLYNINCDVKTFLDHCGGFSGEVLVGLMNHFVHPKLHLYCFFSPVKNEEMIAKTQTYPSVPLLLELARNKLREFLIRKYKIANSMQFYTLIKHLPISEIHKKMITFERNLY